MSPYKKARALSDFILMPIKKNKFRIKSYYCKKLAGLRLNFELTKRTLYHY